MATTKVYEYEGKTYSLDSTLTVDQAKDKIINYLKTNPTKTNNNSNSNSLNVNNSNKTEFKDVYENTTPDESIYDEDLIANKKFIEASKILFKMNNGVAWDEQASIKSSQGKGQRGRGGAANSSNRDLGDTGAAKYGIEMMGFFNYNLPKMTLDAARIHGATESQKRAFLYLMQSYDDLGVSWKGTGRFFKGIASDPTTYVGLGTFGLVAAGGQVAKVATKEGLMQLLKHSIKAGLYTGAEGFVYAATDNVARQVVETSVSGEDIDKSEVLTSGLTGFAIGKGLGTGVTFGGKYVSAKLKGKKGAPTKETINTDDLIDEGDISNLESLNNNTKSTIKKGLDTSPEKINTKMDSVLKELDRVAPAGKTMGLGDDGVQNLTKLEKVSNQINDVLLKASAKTPDEIANFLSKSKMAENQQQVLQNSSQTIVDKFNNQVNELIKLAKKTEDVNEVSKLRLAIDKLENLKAPVDTIYIGLSRSAARRLRQTQKSTTTGEGRGLSVKSIMEEEGLNRIDAENKFADVIDQANKSIEIDVDLKQLNKKIDEATTNGKFLEAKELRREANLLKAEINNNVLSQNFSAKIGRGINLGTRALNEVIIGNVFSPLTIALNTIPSTLKVFYKPFLNNIMRDGITSKAFRQMGAEYASIKGVWKTAGRAALAAFRYERAVLTGDTARFLESYNVIPKKYLGGVVRTFPRILLTTDAAFEQIFYRQFIVGDATAKAIEEGAKKKLKGKDLDAFIKGEVDTAVKNAYEPVPNAADILTDEAISRGKIGRLGKSVDDWVAQELEKNGDLMVGATNKAGKDYTLDVLFKRDFSGKSSISYAAKGYENFVNKYPQMRLIGQLFFRTPIRVFEEGFRLTPGLNLALPSFRKDLAGGKGVPIHRQVRAQGEALASLTVVGAVFGLYATGNITGSQGGDYKIRRQGENAGRKGAYMITIGDYSFPYRNLDPFSTPIKIMVNALEGLEELAYRREQGEMVNDWEGKEYYDMAFIAVGSILKSIRDANLFAGAAAAYQLIEDSMKTDNEGEFIKFFGEKVQTAIPNTWYKASLQEDPILNDPATLSQYFNTRIDPSDSTVPKQYTALGRPRTLAQPKASLILGYPETQEDRDRGLSKQELEIENYLYLLARATDTNFTAPYKHPKLPNVDLRTETTVDGKETLYDRWQRYIHEGQLQKALYPLTKANLPIGVPDGESIAVKNVKNVINAFRNVAMIKLLQEEALLTRGINEQIKTKLKSTGTNDSFNLPF